MRKKYFSKNFSRKLYLFSMIFLFVSAFFGTSTTAYAQYGGTPGMVVTPPESSGMPYHLIGHGCAAFEEVSIYLNGVFLGTTISDDQGNFYFDIYSAVDPGEYFVEARCGAMVLNANFMIASPGTKPLPKTGSDNTLLLQSAYGLLGMGGILLTSTRRKTTR